METIEEKMDRIFKSWENIPELRTFLDNKIKRILETCPCYKDEGQKYWDSLKKNSRL